MGKGKRLKRQRAHQAAPVPGGVDGAALAELLVANEVVGRLFGIRPDCAGAAGVLAAVGEALGHRLHPQPVSVMGREVSIGHSFVMGPKARERFTAAQLERLEDLLPGGQDTGHLVLISEDPRLLLDPNLRQLGTYGIEVPSVVIRLRSARPDSGEWQFESGNLQLIYILDDENGLLLPRFNEIRDKSRPLATFVAQGIRSGASAEVIAARVAEDPHAATRAEGGSGGVAYVK